MSEPQLNLVVAPARAVANDLRRNWRWIAAFAGGWLVYLLTSAGIACIWEDWSYLRSCYFTLINMTTVGFGDVTPSTPETMIVAGVNSVVGLLAFGAFVASITMALQPSSYQGSVGLSGLRDADSRPATETPTDENLAKEFVNGLNGLLRLAGREQQKEGTGPPNSVHLDIIVDGDELGTSGYVHMHIRCRR